MTERYNYEEFIKGKIVKTYTIEEDDKLYITFESESKKLELCAIGDCCSHSWFEFPEILQDLINEEITEIEEQWEEEERYSDLKTYKFNFVCKSGKKINFILKNSSNGYYSGWIDIEVIE